MSPYNITTTTAALEAARRACEKREHWEVGDWQRWQEEEQAHQEVTAWREVEAWKAEVLNGMVPFVALWE
jgi:hypothetical protein